ncbi:4-hydroxy-tetrahydrodipicolinate synthase [Odoribacter sp. OttesenSCG-928-L07]|nr:4-hydroxy-tetrahydrodipicolinate synthase [Odoribacter sp. OttesenSCG-928-L07]MDL2238916.1 4-hydroxy-tetrahydrodipicolinate synthase [Bacteroidales bacterium OttesenSCG-928-L14]
MKNSKFLRGTGVAVVTPFNDDQSIDYVSFEKIIENLIENNVNYIVLLGSTGEATTLFLNEQNELIKFASQVINSRVPLIVGCTSNSTAYAVERVKEISKFKVDGILSAAPYYNKPSQEGIFEHFYAIAKATSLPIIIYNVPGRTSSNILPDTCLMLAESLENIVAIKEASGNINQVMEIIKNNHIKDFLVISGEDALNVPLMSIGAAGTISVIGNAFPHQVSEMIRHCSEDDIHQASTIHYDLLNITNYIFSEGNPAGIKALLSYMDMCNNVLRLPLMPVSQILNELLANECDKILEKYED